MRKIFFLGGEGGLVVCRWGELGEEEEEEIGDERVGRAVIY